MAAYFTATRQTTGAVAHHAYVYPMGGNRPIASCHHFHRTAKTATACAKRMLRQIQRRDAGGK